jgi:hypothetical protein
MGLILVVVLVGSILGWRVVALILVVVLIGSVLGWRAVG